MFKRKINNYFLYVLVILGYLILAIFLYVYYPTFANSNLFFSSTTFFVGSFALFIYTKQKFEEKGNAATTVLLEIRNAESKIELIIDKLDKKSTTDLPSVLPTNSWRRYSHLFVRDLDLDDIQLLNTFYTSCEIIEDLAKRQNDSIWISTEERAKTVQNILAQIHDDFQKDFVDFGNDVANKKFAARRDGLNKFYKNEDLTYAPEKILTGLKFQTTNLQRVASTPCGVKLKELANLK